MEEKVGFFKRLKNGLSKTRDSFVSGIDSLFTGFSEIDDDFYEELEELLVMGDIGINTTMSIIDGLKERVKEEKIKEASACKQLLIDTIKEQMQIHEDAYEFEHKKSVLLLIGVNGVGKTTSVGKLAGQFKNQGKKVMLAAADTFRAGALDQLKEWANRAGVDIIAGQEGSDPAAIVYDAVAAAKARDVDILLCDTAGRLHNKKNLMAELHKIHTIIEKEYPEALLETMIVVDGTTGQNALAQAKEFSEVADVSGVILTKLDGTAKGGIAIAIQSELSIPVKYIGIGEQIGDLQRFDAEEFVNALFEEQRKVVFYRMMNVLSLCVGRIRSVIKSGFRGSMNNTQKQESVVLLIPKAYEEKTKRGERIKELQKELKDTKEKLEKKSKRLEQLEQEKKQMEKHFLGRLVLGKYKK